MVTTLTQAGLASSSSVPAHCGISYALGPVDESSLVRVAMRSEGGFDFVLLVPGLADLSRVSAFCEGAAAGYDYGDGFAETPVQMANEVYRSFSAELRRGGSYAWTVGFLLGCLSAFAEEDYQLALVGIAHLCFLVAHVPECSRFPFSHVLHDMDCLHNAVLRVYRGRVRVLKEQGMVISEAWRAALMSGCVSNGKPLKVHARAVGLDGWPLDL